MALTALQRQREATIAKQRVLKCLQKPAEGLAATQRNTGRTAGLRRDGTHNGQIGKQTHSTWHSSKNSPKAPQV